jgi:hypothetical protein
VPHAESRPGDRISRRGARLPPRLPRPVRRGRGDIRPAVQHPGVVTAAFGNFRGDAGGKFVVAVPGHHRPRDRAADHRAAVRARRPHPPDPPFADAERAGRARLRGRARLARAARAATAAGGDAGRAARGGDRLPPGRAASRDARAGGRPLHRRDRARRHGRPAGHRRGLRRRRLAVGPHRRRDGRPGLRRRRARAAAAVAKFRAAADGRDVQARPDRSGIADFVRDRSVLDGRVRRGLQRDRIPADRSAVPARGGRGRSSVPRLPGRLVELGGLRAAGRPVRPPLGAAVRPGCCSRCPTGCRW